MKWFSEQLRKRQTISKWLFLFPAIALKLWFCFGFFHRYKVPEGYRKSVHNEILVSWHNRILFFPAFFPRSTRKRTASVASASRDGGYLTHLLNWFAITVFRGSSCKRGAAALRGTVKIIEDGYNVCFTSDGPRGPLYYLHPGAVYLASVSGRPIRPLSINSSRYWAYKTWDKFQIPKPFATLTLEVSELIYIPPNLTSEELEQYRQKVEKALMEITRD